MLRIADEIDLPEGSENRKELHQFAIDNVKPSQHDPLTINCLCSQNLFTVKTLQFACLDIGGDECRRSWPVIFVGRFDQMANMDFSDSENTCCADRSHWQFASYSRQVGWTGATA